MTAEKSTARPSFQVEALAKSTEEDRSVMEALGLDQLPADHMLVLTFFKYKRQRATSLISDEEYHKELVKLAEDCANVIAANSAQSAPAFQA